MAEFGVAVVGGGTWGLALAAAVARARGEALLHTRRTFGGDLPPGISVTRELRDVGARSRLIFLAVPSVVARDVARSLGDYVDGRHLIVHGVRGLVGDDLQTVSAIVRTETPVRRVGALGGPVLADELLRGGPSVMVCGSHFPEVNAAVREALATRALSVFSTPDLTGLEWASALVAGLAIGVGYARGLKVSPGLSAAITTRAVHEAARLAQAAGGDARTLLGLAGFGDLFAAIAQQGRPEVMLGEALANGVPSGDALGRASQRIEAVELVPRLVAWADRHGVQAPMFRSIASITRGDFGVGDAESLVQELIAGTSEDA
jgi:glycerol-3-phosphate dehydrogenase (NAD(P)+)